MSFEEPCNNSEMEKKARFQIWSHCVDSFGFKVWKYVDESLGSTRYLPTATADFFFGQALQYFSYISPLDTFLPINRIMRPPSPWSRGRADIWPIKSETCRHKIRVSLRVSQQWKFNLNGPQLAPSRNWSSIPEKVDGVEFWHLSRKKGKKRGGGREGGLKSEFWHLFR